MSNIRLGVGPVGPALTLDWLLTPQGLFDDTHELEFAVIMAIGTDRRANADDPLPLDGDTDRRGWWGDTNAELIWDGWPVGSRLWLLSRAKITDQSYKYGSTVARVEAYLNECLLPFVKAGIATRLDVSAQRYDEQTITAIATLYRGTETLIALEFQPLWNDL
ncbi:hypothetical protein LMIY3S_03703 [Labrys miyagiensis]